MRQANPIEMGECVFILNFSSNVWDPWAGTKSIGSIRTCACVCMHTQQNMNMAAHETKRNSGSIHDTCFIKASFVAGYLCSLLQLICPPFVTNPVVFPYAIVTVWPLCWRPWQQIKARMPPHRYRTQVLAVTWKPTIHLSFFELQRI